MKNLDRRIQFSLYFLHIFPSLSQKKNLQKKRQSNNPQKTSPILFSSPKRQYCMHSITYCPKSRNNKIIDVHFQIILSICINRYPPCLSIEVRMKAKEDLQQYFRQHRELSQLGAEEQVIKKYFRVYKNLLDIIEKRGYLVDQIFKSKDYGTFRHEYLNKEYSNKSQLFLYYDHYQEMSKEKLVIFYNFCNEDITEEYIRRVIQSAPDIRKFLIVESDFNHLKPKKSNTESKRNNFIRELAIWNKDQSSAIRIQIFKCSNLLINILNHHLVPRHTPVKEEEKMSILMKYKIKEGQLPKLLLSEPVAVLMDFRKGQLIKILRPTQSGGYETTYRIVS